MKLAVRLFIQKHDNRSYTVTVPTFPGISAYGPTLEECKEELAEVLIKRLSELSPESYQHVALKPSQSLEKVIVELRPTDQHGKRRRESLKLTVSLLMTPDEGQILINVPRLRHPPLAFYVPSREELHAIAQLELIQYFHGASFETLLAYQAARQESIDVLEVEFKPKKATEKEDEEEESSFWALKQSGTNLTAQASEGQLRRAFRREAEVDAVLSAIAGERRPSILLLGQSGVGKTAIAHEVARRIKRKEAPEALHDRQVWAVTGASLLAGCTYIGQWQEKLNDVVREVRKKRHILFIEDLPSLSEAGRYSKSDDNMADFLKAHVQSGDVIIIGESSPERLRRAEQLTPGFVAQFRTLEITPTGEADTLSILTAVSRELERSEDVRLEPSALEAAVELTNRFLPYRAQPGKAITLLEQMAAEANRKRAADVRPVLRRQETIASFTAQTGLPEFIVADNQPLDLQVVWEHFADRIIGQRQAIDAMVDLIATVKAGLSDPEKPLGTFLFIGPTGVGKTQLAKTLAQYLFGDEKRMVRFDMSEYSDPAGVRRLIGLPGSGQEGELTGRVRNQPFCVLLLDEFEKADPQIYDVFLQVMGEGRLTDASGQTTSFQNAIIVLTSNLGASAKDQRRIGLADERRRTKDEGNEDAMTQPSSFVLRPSSGEYWQRKIEEFFRPEFVNRIDHVALDEVAMRQIARRELGEVLLRDGFVRRNVLVEIDENVIDLLIEQGFNPLYGARPLKRAVEKLIVLPLARFLSSRDKPGADLLRLERQDGQIALRAAQFAGGEAFVALEGEGSRRRKLDDKGLAEVFAELRRKLYDWAERDAVVEMRNERATRLADTNKPTFWDNQTQARETLARFYFLDRLLKRLQQLTDRAEYLEELSGLVNRQRDARYRAELVNSFEQLDRDYAFLEVELLCAHLKDAHSAMLYLRRMGMSQRGDEAEGWVAQLAAMYVQWAARKGYDLECWLLEPIAEEQKEAGELIDTYYPFRWRSLGEDVPTLLETLRSPALQGASEIALSLHGTNVFGFLKSEVGVHRRNDKRPSGERVQRLAQVSLQAPGDAVPVALLDGVLHTRATAEQERAKSKKPAAANSVEPEIIRVYQFDSEKSVRDMRTKLKLNDPFHVLEGQIDDLILAYLRDKESQQAWG
jgi:ATP-dependent Clp protease ATP-binding subunit ClpA/protein subunit release factor A/predicted RNase H-like HicB family nuclease